MSNFDKAIKIIMAEPPELHYPAYYADLLREADLPDISVGKCSEIPNSSDTISRQEAIDAIAKYLGRLQPPGTWKAWRSTGKVILDIVPSAESEPPWIPISDGLPKKSGVYTVTNHKDEVVRYTFNNSKTSKDYWKRCVKAWMPLPEPYKGG